MRSRIVLLFVLALFCAGGAAYLVMKKVQQMDQPTAQAVAQTQPILIATRDLPTGSVIAQADVRVMDWPSQSWPVGGMAPDSIAFGETVVKLPIAQNTPIIDSQIVRTSEGGAMAYVVAPGQVAMAIAVGVSWGSTAASGHVTPGTYVDILYTHAVASDLTGEAASVGPISRVAETLLVGVKVLAIDLQLDDVNPESRVTQTVIVEVSPKEAEILLLAGANTPGALTLSLNSAVEPTPADLLKVADVRRGVIPSYTTETELWAVLGYSPSMEEEPEDKVQQVGHTVFVFRGTAVQEISLPAAGMRGVPGQTPEGELIDASGPADPAVEAQGDADAKVNSGAATQVPSAQPAAVGDPQPVLPQRIDLRGGSS